MCATPWPTSITSPIEAWPRIVGGILPSSPRQFTQSVEQNGEAPVRTSTPPGAGPRKAMSSTTNGSLNATNNAARTAVDLALGVAVFRPSCCAHDAVTTLGLGA